MCKYGIGGPALKKIIDLLLDVSKLATREDFEKSDDFISDGLLDSLSLQMLVADIWKEYGVSMSGTDLVPMNFSSFDAIRDLLESKGVKGDF